MTAPHPHPDVRPGRKERCEQEGHEPAREPHTCPYQFDVNDDSEFRCVCCANCETDCADDI